MSNTYFQFKEFRIDQERTAMKVTTDGCLLGAWASQLISGDSLHQGQVLDIGTGTGLLSLMIAQVTNHRIDSVEMEDQAAIQALENIAHSKWKDRIQLIHADIREYTTECRYDYIVSNPPFYENELKSGRQEKDMAHHDAGLSLTELFASIDRLLSPDGKFYLLLPFKRKEEVK